MVRHRRLAMLQLRRRCGLMRRPRGGLLHGSRPCRDAAGPAVEADPVDRDAIDYRLVVYVVNVGDIHMAHRAVVIKFMTLPMSAGVTAAGVSETVVDAPVEPDGRAPVAFVPRIPPVAPTPIPRRPEQPKFGRLHPGPGNPEVAVLVVVPIAWGPNTALLNEHRLFIHGQ